MSDTSQGPGWWLASDGKWYPPQDSSRAPAPGWWLASDGKWYPPVDDAPAPGWWLASDGRWYPPERKPSAAAARGERPSKSRAGRRPADRPVDDRPAADRVDTAAPPAAGRGTGPNGRGSSARPGASGPNGGRTAAPARPAPSERSRPAAPSTPRPSVPAARATPASPGNGRSTGTSTGAGAAARPAASGRPPAADPSRTTTPTTTPSSTGTEPVGRPNRTPDASASTLTAEPLDTGAAAPRLRVVPPIDDPVAHDERGTGDQHDDDFVFRPSGADPQEQIAQRDQQSRRDAEVLAEARRKAAARALQALTGAGDLDELDAEDEADEPTAPAAVAPLPSPPTTPAAPPAPPAPAATVEADEPDDDEPAPPRATPAPVGDQDAEPLLVVQPPQMFADIEHIGEHLLVFADRVELRDRHDEIVAVIASGDVGGVEVAKRFTGATVAVQSTDGTVISMKGLKPVEADEVRAVVLAGASAAADDDLDDDDDDLDDDLEVAVDDVLEPAIDAARAEVEPSAGVAAPTVAGQAAEDDVTTSPAAVTPAPPTPAVRVTGPKTSVPTPSADNPFDEIMLVVHLNALHAAGVLTDDELRDKVALVARLGSDHRRATAAGRQAAARGDA